MNIFMIHNCDTFTHRLTNKREINCKMNFVSLCALLLDLTNIIILFCCYSALSGLRFIIFTVHLQHVTLNIFHYRFQSLNFVLMIRFSVLCIDKSTNRVFICF